MKSTNKKIEVKETLAERLRWLREERKLSKVDLAVAAGVSQGAIQLIEKGATRKPSAEVIAKLAALFGCTEAYLLEGTK